MRERTRLLPRRGEVELTRAPAREERAPPGACRAGPPAHPRPRRRARSGARGGSRASKRSARTAARRCGRASRRASRRTERSRSTARPRARSAALAVIDDTRRLPRARDRVALERGRRRGAGRAALAWNLVSGVNDPPRGSERAVWVAGAPHEAPAVSFSEDLTRIGCADGSRAALRRPRRSAAAQRQPADRRAATTARRSAPSPGRCRAASRWRAGLGVVEHHRARW